MKVENDSQIWNGHIASFFIFMCLYSQLVFHLQVIFALFSDHPSFLHVSTK